MAARAMEKRLPERVIQAIGFSIHQGVDKSTFLLRPNVVQAEKTVTVATPQLVHKFSER